MNKSIKIGILGCGTVGTGVVKVFSQNKDIILGRCNGKIEISKILVRDLHKKRNLPNDIVFTENPEEILADENIDIVVELMGGINPAYDYIKTAILNKKHVITANKDVVAAFGWEIEQLALDNNVEFMYEASVAGGIPIITPLKESLAANEISHISGIVNGTTNYMLTKMAENNMDYQDALLKAQQKGYAEADPTSDVTGLDAARKIAILASIAFDTKITLQDVFLEGITSITKEDITCAEELGYTIKLIANATKSENGIAISVRPTFIPKEHPLSSVRNSYNAIFFHGNVIGDAMFLGKGAGEKPTASAVLSDIIAVTRNILNNSFNRVRSTFTQEKIMCPKDKIFASYFLRLVVEDKPGVLGKIATVFGISEVSLKSVIQKRKIEEYSEIVAITHKLSNVQLDDLRNRLSNLDVVKEIANIIPVSMPQED